MNYPWVVRSYQDGDEEGILDLVEATYPGRWDRNIWLKHWEWLYKENPCGSVIWVADLGGKIVGHGSHIFANVKVGTRTVKGAIAADLMTHPDFRRQGVFKSMVRYSDQYLVEKDVGLEFFFPSEIISKAQSSVRSTESEFRTFHIPILMHIIDPRMNTYGRLLIRKPLSKIFNFSLKKLFRSRDASKARDLDLINVPMFDDRFDDFWREVSRFYRVILVRDSEYLNWRYVNNPDLNAKILTVEDGGKILGYIVIASKAEELINTGYILDFIAYPNRDDAASFLIQNAIEHLRENDDDILLTLMFKNHHLYRVLISNGFLPIPKYIKIMTRVIGEHQIGEIVSEQRNWFMMIGDSDGLIMRNLESYILRSIRN